VKKLPIKEIDVATLVGDTTELTFDSEPGEIKIITSEKDYQEEFQAAGCGSPEMADLALLAISSLKADIAKGKRAYDDALEELKIKHADYFTKMDNLAGVERDLKEFAVSIKDGLEDGVMKLKNGKLMFVKSAVPSLEIGVKTEELIKALKAAFPADQTYYLHYIKVSTEPKKNELKNAIKTQALSPDFCLKNKLELLCSEKFEYEISI